MWCKCIVVTFKCIDQTIIERSLVIRGGWHKVHLLSSSASMHYQVHQYHYSSLIRQSVKEHWWSENKSRSSAIEIWSTGRLCHKKILLLLLPFINSVLKNTVKSSILHVLIMHYFVSCIGYQLKQISVICLIFHLCSHLLEILSTPPNIGKHIRVSTKNLKAALARFFADEQTHYRKNIWGSEQIQCFCHAVLSPDENWRWDLWYQYNIYCWFENKQWSLLFFVNGK